MQRRCGVRLIRARDHIATEEPNDALPSALPTDVGTRRPRDEVDPVDV